MKVIEVIADSGHADTVAGIAAQQEVVDYWRGSTDEDGRCAMRLVVNEEQRQSVLDALQAVLATSETARILIQPLEVVLPRPEKDTQADANEEESRKTRSGLTREELYNQVEKNSRLDGNYVLLVTLSTVVVAIGLLKDNVAVVIGAMVIAPLLGPNIALALGTALGDTALMWKAFKTSISGMLLALGMSLLIGWLWPLNVKSQELISRTDVGLDSAALALASGAAAVLSLTAGQLNVLVGVMVAVALLPPTATVGLMLGAGHLDLATGAALLLAVNIVCINLSAKAAFFIKGVRPRTWLEKQKAKQSVLLYISIWLFSLLFLLAVVYWRHIPF